jgi:hypothetical protein
MIALWEGGTLFIPIFGTLLHSRRHAVFAAFALTDSDLHARAVDVLDFQIGDFTDPQTGRVGRHQDNPVFDIARCG